MTIPHTVPMTTGVRLAAVPCGPHRRGDPREADDDRRRTGQDEQGGPHGQPGPPPGLHRPGQGHAQQELPEPEHGLGDRGQHRQVRAGKEERGRQHRQADHGRDGGAPSQPAQAPLQAGVQGIEEGLAPERPGRRVPEKSTAGEVDQPWRSPTESSSTAENGFTHVCAGSGATS